MQQLNQIHRVTSRERQVAALTAMGLTNRQIGERLGVAEETVRSHMSNIMPKLGASRRAEVAAVATRLGWNVTD